MTKSKLQSLISLLDDPDENIAVTVMGELLKNEAELMPLLGELQEADNKLLRKRVQQLETIIMLRNRRRNFLSRIDGGECDIADGLVELHLLYFDRDTPEMIRSLIELFVNVALNNNISSVDELGAFMAQNNFVLPMPDEKLEPENYCVGPILEDRIGSDILLCTLALLAGVHSGLPLELLGSNPVFHMYSDNEIIIEGAKNIEHYDEQNVRILINKICLNVYGDNLCIKCLFLVHRIE